MPPDNEERQLVVGALSSAFQDRRACPVDVRDAAALALLTSEVQAGNVKQARDSAEIWVRNAWVSEACKAKISELLYG